MNYYFITGTSFGLGKALAEALTDRKDVFVYGVSRTCTIKHSRYKHLYVDLALPDTDVVLAEELQQISDAESINLINNAGVIHPIHHLGNFLTEEIQHLLQVNLLSPVQWMNTFIANTKQFKGTSVILNISSGAGKKVVDGWSLYGSAKAALDHASRHAAIEQKLLGRTNRHIFSVAPGVVDTAMQQMIRETDRKEFSELTRFLDLQQSNQLMPSSEVASLYLRILDQPDQFHDTVFSIRTLF